MPNLNHRFSLGRMNKDLDERLVPNGEYRDALNIEVATSDTSDMGTVQTVMGNLNMSLITIDPNNTGEFYCVGSVVNEQHDKIYWMLAGRTSDIIAEYDYKTQTTTPVVVDLFPAGTIPGNESGRVLNFDRAFTITGINIIENMLFWTDNYSEPKRIHIDRCKLGTSDFTSQTQLYVRDISTNNASIDYYPKGNLTHEHITVIKKSPPAPPVLEMRNKLREEQGQLQTQFGASYALNITGSFNSTDAFFDTNNDPIQNYSLNFISAGALVGFPDFIIGDIINIYSDESSASTSYLLQSEKTKYVRAEITTYDITTGAAILKILSGDKNLISANSEWYVELEQAEPLFQFKFPRFGIRYKYEDGEYSSFSPFSQVAFLPQEFDYLPKEGYNLGMVNNLRFLAIKDFVHGQSIPDDVISVDILYKESNSPNIYTVKTIKRLENDWVPGFEPWSNNILSLDDATANYSEWNAVGPRATGTANGLVSSQFTRGWTRITSEMIHAILPANQLLRPYDNVPRVALAQEVVGNRLVYGNYLQNYNMFNRFAVNSKALQYYSEFNFGELDPQSKISVDIKTSVSSNSIMTPNLLPEQIDAFYNNENYYSPTRSVKTLRTYQLGVAYIDEYGRETPVFSNSTIDKASLYIEKVVADKKNKLEAQLYNTHPEWAKSYKFFVKETSSEYYNLAMDRWYNAEDGNIWVSFPSSERNKIDEETFLILKKEHDTDVFVNSPARYKVIAIENEAPLFIKTTNLQQPVLVDTKTSSPFDIGGAGATGFPELDGKFVTIDKTLVNNSGWTQILNLDPTNPATDPAPLKDFDIRFIGTASSGSNFASNWYRIKGVKDQTADYRFDIFKKFESDVQVLSSDGTINTYTGGGSVELRRRIVENKPEFDGRFFVKIKRDSQLEQSLIKNISSALDWQVISSRRVQYINPDSDFSKSGQAHFFGVTGKRTAIHISENQEESNYDNSGHARGGQEFWGKASHNLADGDANSSGWFIDRVEGFRRFKTTEHYFKVKNQDPWLAKDFANSTTSNHFHQSSSLTWFPKHNWFSSQNGQTNAMNRYLMPVVMGTATSETSHTRSYLYGVNNFGFTTNGPSYKGTGPNGEPDYLIDPNGVRSRPFASDFNAFASANNINGAADYINQTVLRTGLNGYLQDQANFGNLASNGGEIIQSLGIDGHANAGGSNPDHSGLVGGVNSYQGTGIITISHSGVGEDLDGTDENGKDAPGEGDTMADLVLHFDYVDPTLAKHVEDIVFINFLTTPNTVWRWSEDPDQRLYKTIVPDPADLTAWGITQREIDINFRTVDTIDSKPGIGLYNYCRVGDWCDYISLYYSSTSPNKVDTGWWVSGGIKGHSNATDPVYFTEYNFYSDATGTGQDQVNWRYSQEIGKSITNVGMSFKTNNSSGSSWVDRIMNPINNEANSCGGWDQAPSQVTKPTDFSRAHGFWPMYVKDWWKGINRRRRYMIVAEAYEDGSGLGEKGSMYLPTNDPYLPPHFDSNSVLKTGAALPSTPAPGIRSDGVYSGYSINGVVVPSGPTKDTSAGAAGPSKYPGSCTWQIVSPYITDDTEKYSSTNPAIFETEPKESVDLNIYYEVGQIYPIELNERTGEQFVGPVHRSFDLARYNSKVTCYDPNPNTNPSGALKVLSTDTSVTGGPAIDIRVQSIVDNVLTLCNIDGEPLSVSSNANASLPLVGDILTFVRADGGKTETSVLNVNAFTGEIELDRNLHNYKVTLPWHNCYSFGNGVESDRIRDDFNQVTIDNGPKASTTLEEPYEEERRGSGLIYSGIYNSMSGVNNLNQFIQAEKITKDLNPSYGTIQKLYARNTNLVTLCEDKVFKILANKDALFNADGNSNVTATDRVLGQTIPYAGEFGISKNPESFVNESYRAYFTDKVRGQVLRLSQDGITPISDAGMGDWFSDNLKLANRLIGSYDEKKDEYNLTLDHNEYPIAQPVQVIDNFMVEIESENCGCGGNYDVPTGRIITSIQQSVAVGMVLNGPSLAPNTVVTAVTPNFSQLILTVNPEPAFVDVVSLFGPNPSGWQTHVALGTQPDPVSTYTNTSGNYDLTVSFSERSKGWTSFKSWAQESGVSLNNTYYTFKGGHLHEHHVESQPRNNFYGDQYDSSIEVLFNESPEIVKSFNTLNYEGTQSRVTPDTENSGEYWDNYLHTGWYVSNMLTNLQEGSMQEFREKEGKWFSQIKGVTTEWLDDGKAGNIDTREFSYQGIDRTEEVTIISGGYTSYDCRACPGFNGYNGLDLNNPEQGAPITVSSNNPNGNIVWNPIYDSLGLGALPNQTPHYQQASGQVFTGTIGPSGNEAALEDVINQIWEYFWQNPTLKFWDDYHEIQGVAIAGYPSLNPGFQIMQYAREHFYFINGINMEDGWYATPLPLKHASAAGNVTYFLTAQETINYFSTNYSGNFYNGMSWADFKSELISIGEILYNTGVTDFGSRITDYGIIGAVSIGHMHAIPCSGAGFSCQERQDPNGQYPTLSACEAVCGANQETYECISGQCVDPGDGSGSYSTYCECVNDSLCCDEGLAYAYTCQNIAEPTPVILGCMDDGITTDLYTTRFRPSNWSVNTDYGGPSLGAASNYYPAANTPDCSCQYNIPPIPVTYDCSGITGTTITLPDGTTQTIAPYTCYDPGDGTGQYTDSGAVAAGYINAQDQCDQNCQSGPCNYQNYFGQVQINVINADSTNNCTNGEIGVSVGQILIHDLAVELQDLFGNVLQTATISQSNPQSVSFTGLFGPQDYVINIYETGSGTKCGYSYQREVLCTQIPACQEQNFGATTTVTQEFIASDCTDHTTITSGGTGTFTLSVPNNGYGQPNQADTFEIIWVHAIDDVLNQAPNAYQDITSSVLVNGANIAGQQYNITSTILLSNISFTAAQAASFANNSNSIPTFRVLIQDSNGCGTPVEASIRCTEPTPESFNCVLDADGISVICVDPLDGTGYFSVANGFSSPQSACNMAAQNGTTPCDLITLPDYTCVLTGGFDEAGSPPSFSCTPVAPGTGQFTGPTALADCNTAVANNQSPCELLPELPEYCTGSWGGPYSVWQSPQPEIINATNANCDNGYMRMYFEKLYSSPTPTNYTVKLLRAEPNGLSVVPHANNNSFGNNQITVWGGSNLNTAPTSPNATTTDFASGFLTSGLGTPNQAEDGMQIYWDGLLGGYGNPVDGFGTGQPTYYFVELVDDKGCYETFGPFAVAGVNGCNTNPGGGNGGTTSWAGCVNGIFPIPFSTAGNCIGPNGLTCAQDPYCTPLASKCACSCSQISSGAC